MTRQRKLLNAAAHHWLAHHHLGRNVPFEGETPRILISVDVRLPAPARRA